MSAWTSLLARIEGSKAYAPAAIAAFQAAGITVNADGTITMPDGTQGTFNASTGIITLADGSDVALPAYDPNGGQSHSNPLTSGVPVDLTVIWKESKGAVIGGGIGAVVGAALGVAAIPMAARVGALAGAALAGSMGAWVGSKVG